MKEGNFTVFTMGEDDPDLFVPGAPPDDAEIIDRFHVELIPIHLPEGCFGSPVEGDVGWVPGECILIAGEAPPSPLEGDVAWLPNFEGNVTLWEEKSYDELSLEGWLKRYEDCGICEDATRFATVNPVQPSPEERWEIMRWCSLWLRADDGSYHFSSLEGDYSSYVFNLYHRVRRGHKLSPSDACYLFYHASEEGIECALDQLEEDHGELLIGLTERIHQLPFVRTGENVKEEFFSVFLC